MCIGSAAAQTTGDITTGLIGHWTFNEGSGTTTADSSGGYTGTLQGGANAPVWIAGNGTSGTGALHFIGNGSDVSLPNIPFQNTFSFSFWIHNDANTSNYTDPVSWGFGIYVSYVYNALYFTIDGSAYDGVGTTCVNYSGWHNVVATYDGTAQNLYCDNVLIGTSPRAFSASSGTPMLFAEAPGGGGNYTGYLNDVRLYSRALTAADVNTLYTTTSGLQPTVPNVGQTLVQAGNLFFSQSGGSETQNGSSCANSLPISWLDNQNNWGNVSGEIGPGGGTINLCGVITQTVYIMNGGAPGNPLRVYFQPANGNFPNAKISSPANSGIVVENYNASYGTPVSNLVIDGGGVGIIENTDNGTPGDINPNTGNTYGNHVGTSGIQATNVSNFEVKNLTMQNLYVHTSDANGLADTYDPADQGAAITGSYGSNISIHDNTFHDTEDVILMGPSTGASGFNFYNNNLYNYNHGVVGIGGLNAAPANVNIYNNHFGSTANWDTTANAYHHDGIYVFYSPGGSLSGGNIYNNLFDGNWGNNNTAYIALWGADVPGFPGGISNFNIFNNVLIEYPGDNVNDGLLSVGGVNVNVFNNTCLGGGVTNSWCGSPGGVGISYENNIVSGFTSFANDPGTGDVNVWDYNLYADAIGGGNPPWDYVTYSTSYQIDSISQQFSLWQNATHYDADSQYAASAELSNCTFPSPNDLTGSELINCGYPQDSSGWGTNLGGPEYFGKGINLSTVTNLSSTGIIQLNYDRNGVARSSTGAWDMGAYVDGSPIPANTSVPASPITVNLTSDQASYSSPPATIVLLATAIDSTGTTINRVDFYNGTNCLTCSGASISPTTTGGNTYSYTWTGVGPGTYTFTAIASDSKGSAMSSPWSAMVGWPLTVSNGGAGSGLVYGNNPFIYCGVNSGTTYTACGATDPDSIEILTATAASGSIFTGWTITGSPSNNTCTGTTSPCSFTVNAATTVTANFVLSTVLGDPLGLGTPTIADAEATAQYAIGLSVANFNSANAKVDGNSTVDIYDAYLIAEYTAGLINQFPAH